MHIQTKNYHFYCISKPKRTLFRCISKPKTYTWAITTIAKKVGVLQNTIIHPPLTLNLSYNNLFPIVNIYTRNIWLSK